MTKPTVLNDRSQPGGARTCHERDGNHAHLHRAIEHAAHRLPAQGPIAVFVHHNTLHAFETMPFTGAVEQAAFIYGCEPYLSEDQYRRELGRGRIRLADLEAIRREELAGEAERWVPPGITRLKLQMAMLQYPLRFGPTAELLWFVAETDALRRVRTDASAAARGRLIAETRRWALRDLRGRYEARRNGKAGPTSCTRDWSSLCEVIERFGAARMEAWDDGAWEAFTLQVLWRVCCDATATLVGRRSAATAPPVRLRDWLLRATGIDTDLCVHSLLIPFCAAMLDQGVASWHLPERDAGFYQAFCSLYRMGGAVTPRWQRGLARELARLQDEQISPFESIRESLDALGVPPHEWDDFFSATLLALRGWAGMIRFLEEHPDRAVHPVPAGSLIEYLAIRLVLERFALQDAARTLGLQGRLDALRNELRRRVEGSKDHDAARTAEADSGRDFEPAAFAVFQLAQVLGWTPAELHSLSSSDWSSLVCEIEAFSDVERRRSFHLAYERRFYAQSLDAISLHNRTLRQEVHNCRFQAMFCIDEREESIRRHLEEVAAEVETFGIAGFYFVPMYFRGMTDAHFVPLCPIAIQPDHWVIERPVERERHEHGRRRATRSALGKASHGIHTGSRTLAAGALVSSVLGVLATVPLVARTFFPRLTAHLRGHLGRLLRESRRTRLQLERDDEGSADDGRPVGFTLDELTDIAERVLRDTGLTANFARLVLTFGHGSTSSNNPHESAHNCGACGGGEGGPNGRAIAQILNDRRIRQRLATRGLRVPDDTVFVGAMHNTSSDEVTYYDLDDLPESHRRDVELVRALVDAACDRDAHERCRRFESAPLSITPAEARRHVEGRAEDLAQVRPEWGHATNALTIVGRRKRTRGLFLDRRAFLCSYDPTQDDADATILTRILLAVVPVCAGISLEYYFSRVDNPGYGCGTKLPQNITALVGVMDGAASDLRTGLPWEMVEVHEPLRHLFVVEAAPDTVLRILERHSDIGRLVRNQWVQLATLDPHSSAVHVYRDGAFQPYQPQAEYLPWAAASVDWYRGWRDHLEFAEIGGTSHDHEAGEIRPSDHETECLLGGNLT